MEAPIHTQGSYWGGTVLPYWILILVTLMPITGFFGIDHLLFRSPSTAVAKGFTNIFTLGFWYFYDIIQVLGDREYIKKYGLSRPIVGASALGKDFFRGVVKGKPDSLSESTLGISSTLLFGLYVLTLFVPFGVRHFVAGDMNAGIIEFLLSFAVIWIPFFIIGGFYELYRLVLNPTSVFEEGVSRVPPLTFFMDSKGFAPQIMNPQAVEKMAKTVSKGASATSIWSFFIKPALSIFGVADPIEEACAVAVPLKKQAEEVIDAGIKATEGATALASTVPAIASNVSEKMTAFTDPAKLKQLALQSGGSMSSGYDILFLGGLSLLIIGGLSASFLRKSIDRNGKDDAPPVARTV